MNHFALFNDRMNRWVLALRQWRATLTEEEKSLLYDAGLYIVRAPDVCTTLWGRRAWIKHVSFIPFPLMDSNAPIDFTQGDEQ